MGVKVGDLGAECLSTEELATLLHVQAQTIRAAHHRHGGYLGMIPIKLPSRLLLWPKKQVEELLNRKKEQPEDNAGDIKRLGDRCNRLLASLIDIRNHVPQDHYAWKIADDAVSAVEQELLS